MINKNQTYAVVGASANEEKYGYKVFKDLLEAGYRVMPVNPKGGEILGSKVYPDIKSVPEKIDVAIFVVPPAVTEKILPEVKALAIKKVWLQPGSESEKAFGYCQNNNLDCIHDACIMIERAK